MGSRFDIFSVFCVDYFSTLFDFYHDSGAILFVFLRFVSRRGSDVLGFFKTLPT